ncbi:hypothetical protein GYA54_02130 [Candidatus Kuenenbacteria bacterium]|nr:hypothetical protein [Candidatus Kuenenbacteria bacterium]
MENLSLGNQTPTNNEEIKKILLENQEILMEIREQTKKTKKYILAGRVISFIYLILIVAPLVLAAIYLPPLIQNYLAPYQELLGNTQNVDGLDVNSINELLDQFKQK